MAKKPETSVQIDSDLDALSQLFEANQYVKRAERELDQAKTSFKAAEEYRNALMDHLDDYTIARREFMARQLSLGETFAKEPMPPWMSKGQDPDKPEQPPLGGGGA